jgi:ribonuclease Z
VLDAARLAEELQVKNLILYHTEDRTLDTRRQRYTAEAKTVFKGQVFVPDDLESITL